MGLFIQGEIVEGWKNHIFATLKRKKTCGALRPFLLCMFMSTALEV